MALLTMTPLTMQAERLFDQLRAHPTLRPDVTAYNVALKSRLSRRDPQGALQLHLRLPDKHHKSSNNKLFRAIWCLLWCPVK